MASFNEMLVREVKKYKQLWNQNTKLHKEAKAREDAWSAIALTLAVPAEQCQTRWRSLRDGYLRRKCVRVKSKRQWVLLEQELGFIDKYLRPRSRRMLHSIAVKPEPDDEEGPEDSDLSAVPAPEHPEFVLPDALPSLPLQLPPPPSVVEERPLDGEELFCLSLQHQLTSLPPRERHVAQVKMLQLLHYAQLGVSGNQGQAAADPAAANLHA